MSTATKESTAIDELAKALDDVSEDISKKSHRLLKLMILIGIGAIVFAVIKQMTSDSEPEPYEPAGSKSS
ncbi:MAG: hypothetical protein ACK5O2_03880 [Microthrixaceae bacterium]